MAGTGSLFYGSGWVIDSGANQHYVLNDKGLKNVVHVSDLNLGLCHPNGTTSKISKIGDIDLTSNVTLFDALVVPEYSVNLLSISKLARDSKMFVGFDEYNCYGLTPRQINGEDSGDCSVNVCMLSKHTWHNILGHPADPVLQVLKHKLRYGNEGTPASVLGGKSPYEIVYGRKLNLNHLRVFGCLCFAKVLNNTDKFASRSEKCVFMGYSNTQKGYKLYGVDHLNFFNDNFFPDTSLQPNDDRITYDHSDGTSTITKHETATHDDNQSETDNQPCVDDSSKGNVFFEPPASSLRCYFQASTDPKWVDAMNAEMEALHRNYTWVLTNLPPDRIPIGNKWVYKIKYKASREVERYKARLVAKGYSHKEGIDYGETFSPVVKMITVRCILCMTINNGWSLYQLDINNAFLYGELVEDVYMTLPQAPRKWNEKLSNCLLKNGFVQNKCDYSLYTKNKDNKIVILLVYVDDIVLTVNDISEINSVKKYLSNMFIKDLGNPKYFLGIEVLITDQGLCLSQRKYCLELINDFGLLGKPVKSPIEVNVTSYKDYSKDSLIKNITVYQ
ncbi:uncharacterized protein [Rutidosis leptorrhynchoides]|uniref:uncharacterized protein n=1 Tax=Rutidosis leptorrhynchoides TaxID=125765 RepID=UPI003A9A62EF